ncbi:MAG: hypothetical protein LC121_06930 [Anaerolineae bacterium]|nr:hypothetical protein [Anaerolineae bacterium]
MSSYCCCARVTMPTPITTITPTQTIMTTAKTNVSTERGMPRSRPDGSDGGSEPERWRRER